MSSELRIVAVPARTVVDAHKVTRRRERINEK